MFKDTIRTIGARYLVAFLNLLLIFINSKVLGREGLGVVGIVYASANLAVIFNSIFCDNTIVYFMNRYDLRTVFIPAYCWAFAGSAIACVALYFLRFIPEGYEITVFGLSVLITLVRANSMMLLGKDRINSFNFVHILQGALLFLLLLGMYFILDYKDIKGYLSGLFGACIIAFLYSMICLSPCFNTKNEIPVKVMSVLKEMFFYGLWSSADNLAEGLTTRLSYFLIQQSGGYGQVGLYDSGVKVSESVWHISNSVSFIAFNRVSKTTDRHVQKRVTLQLFKLTFCALIIVMAIVCCIPEWVYTDYLLTPEFAGIRKVIFGLSWGIVAFGSNRIISHYFIGSGEIKYSAYCSVLGLAILLVAGIVLIPVYGVLGAAITSSIAYSGMLLFSIIVFMRQTRTKPGEFLPSKDDWKALKLMVNG